MDRVRDICYCAYEDCKRNCERNCSLHDFRGQIMTQSLFNTVEGWTENTCEYFMELEKPLDKKSK